MLRFNNTPSSMQISLLKYRASSRSTKRRRSLCLATAGLVLFYPENPQASAGFFPPWREGGRGKYAGHPIAIFGGSSSVGQFDTQNATYQVLAPHGKLLLVLGDQVDPALKANGGDKKINVFGNTNVPANRQAGQYLYGQLTALLEGGAIEVHVCHLGWRIEVDASLWCSLE
ncbi:hypothetical protein SCP_1203720 [Sparassis crispa]|uniref:Uncharacterized protein n=1 Tax=Sparassis crispa TaxID=139825 RepID=A0A401H166_9APHY|nr:hypothetical protein SCP_1203720 [Sparassis crispa]GBE88142.1 hypothetical protein SCP_1203720 [Sparassis crispa]